MPPWAQPPSQTQAPGHRRAKPLSRRDGECPEPLAGSSQEATKERENRRWNDVNPFDNDHFVSTSEASGTVLSPRKRRAPEPHASPGGFLLSIPQCAYEGAEARRSELTDPRSPSRDEAVSAVPTHAPGSGRRARGPPCREAADRAAGRAEPPAHPPRRILRPAPPPPARPALQPAPRCPHPGPRPGPGRPLTGFRGVAIGRVRLDVDVLHARDAAAQDGTHGARRAGPRLGWGGRRRRRRRRRRPYADMAGTRPHGRLPTAAGARPPSPHPRLGPGTDATAALRPPGLRHLGKWSPLAAEGARRRRGIAT